MLLQWGLILSVTTVSVTMLMIIGAFLAVLPEAEQFYQVNRTYVLLLSNSFNIFYILISPLMFNYFNKNYFPCVVFSTLATGVASVGRYLAGTNYTIALIMTIVIAIAHIPIITAPYGLLKLFPDHQKGYAASIPLFLPALGINFCIIYGLSFITNDGINKLSTVQVHNEINNLNFIIACVGIVSTVLTLLLLFKLKSKIVEEESTTANQQGQHSRSFIQSVKLYGTKNKNFLKLVVFWGAIVGINWTYGSLFGVIFKDQGLTYKQIGFLGLVANLSSAIFSNLGTFIKNRYQISTTKIIGYLNIFGFTAAMLIQVSKEIELLQDLRILILLIVVMRAGYSSFVSLAFIELEKSSIPSVIISGIFFWVANTSNFLGMQMVDLIDINISMLFLTMTVAVSIFKVSECYIEAKIFNK